MICALRSTAPTASALLCLGVLFATACEGSPPEPEAWVEIRATRVGVDVMRTPKQKTQGLSGKASLAWDRGMLFPYQRARFQMFWMKDMNFPIDIIWIRDGRISGVEHSVPKPPPQATRAQIPSVRSREVVDSVLEVPAGYARAHGWARGDRVLFGGLASDAAQSE